MESLVVAGSNQIADIVVPVPRFTGAFRNPVPVEIENAALDVQPQPRQPGLLFRLPQGHPGQVTIAIGVAARLQPAVEFAMVGQQGTPAITAYDQGRAGEVRARLFAPERIALPASEQIQEHPRPFCRLGASPGMAGEFLGQVHWIAWVKGLVHEQIMRRKARQNDHSSRTA